MFEFIGFTGCVCSEIIKGLNIRLSNFLKSTSTSARFSLIGLMQKFRPLLRIFSIAFVNSILE